MKLEVKHIAPYLPYDMKCLVEKTTFGKCIEPLVGIKHGKFLVGGKRIDVDEWDFKPILRPLAYLTKDITHNGETFVPILSLLELRNTLFLVYAQPNYKVLETLTYESSQEQEYIVKYSEPYSKVEDRIIEFAYSNRFRRFSSRMRHPYKQPLSVGGQLDMFQKLFEWHFDVFGLIEQGLAIDMNND